MTDLHNRLDEAIARRLKGQSQMDDELDPMLVGLDQLEALRPTPSLNTETALDGRRAFLAQAREELPSNHHRKQTIFPFLNFKEIFAMSRTARVAFVLVLVLIFVVFGGGGLTAFAAQSSLPGQSLYGVKIASENARLAYASDPEIIVALSTEFAARRIDEMTQLASVGHAVPPELLSRLDLHLAQALQETAAMNSPQTSLEQIQQMAQTESAVLAQDLKRIPNDPALEQAAEHINMARALAEAGLADPAQFRAEMLNQNGAFIMMPTSISPTMMPSAIPMPSKTPTMIPTMMPTFVPTTVPTMMPTSMPTMGTGNGMGGGGTNGGGGMGGGGGGMP
jgi:uncharacterized membrane protein YgcG